MPNTGQAISNQLNTLSADDNASTTTATLVQPASFSSLLSNPNNLSNPIVSIVPNASSAQPPPLQFNGPVTLYGGTIGVQQGPQNNSQPFSLLPSTQQPLFSHNSQSFFSPQAQFSDSHANQNTIVKRQKVLDHAQKNRNRGSSLRHLLNEEGNLFLSNQVFEDLDFTNQDLRLANVSELNFKKCWFNRAKLESVNFEKTQLDDAILTEAEGLTVTQLVKAQFDCLQIAVTDARNCRIREWTKNAKQLAKRSEELAKKYDSLNKHKEEYVLIIDSPLEEAVKSQKVSEINTKIKTLLDEIGELKKSAIEPIIPDSISFKMGYLK